MSSKQAILPAMADEFALEVTGLNTQILILERTIDELPLDGDVARPRQRLLELKADRAGKLVKLGLMVVNALYPTPRTAR